LNSADYSVYGGVPQNVYKTRVTDLYELKQRRRTEWAKLDHVVIAAAVRQWHRISVRQGWLWIFVADEMK